MVEPFLDPRDEGPALRRAALLLERVRQDGGSDIADLGAIVATMRRAAAAGRLVHHSALDQMTATLARLASQPCGGASIGEIIRCDALTETGELLARLSRSNRAQADARGPAAVLAT